MITVRGRYILSPTWGECRISYRGGMASSTVPPGPAVHGATVLGARPDIPRHRVGNALRAVKVFVVTAVEVVVLGNENQRY